MIKTHRVLSLILILSLLVISPSIYKFGDKVLNLYNLRQLKISDSSKLYLMNGWLNFTDLSVSETEIPKPALPSDRMIVSERVIGKDFKTQALVTGDKKVLSYKGVLPYPDLIIGDINGNIIKTIPLEYTNTEKNVPGYSISLSNNSDKIALFSQQLLEVVDIKSGKISKYPLDKEINLACQKRNESAYSCSKDFSFYFAKYISNWLNEKSIVFNIYGSLFILDLSSNIITPISGIDHVSHFVTIDNNKIVYTYMPNWESKNAVINIYDLSKQEVVKTIADSNKWGADFLESSPDGKFLLVGEFSCAPLDVDCGGTYRISARIISVDTNKNVELVKNHSYKQNSPIEIFWIK